MKNSTLVVVVVLVFGAGFLLGAYPNRQTQKVKTEPKDSFWDKDVVIYKGNGNATILRPHHICIGNEPHKINDPDVDASEVWVICLDDGKVIIGAAEVTPKP